MSEQTETVSEQVADEAQEVAEVEATNDNRADENEASVEENTEVVEKADVPEAPAEVESGDAETPIADAPVAEATSEESSEEAASTEVEAESSEADGGETTHNAEASNDSSSEETAGSQQVSSSTDENDDKSASNDGDAKKVVRVLAVDQEVEGTVKRLTDFGAFVDIGVGRDGLLHVSELSLQRVGKVSDVLKKGQKVTVWIKQLDRERNRISLTMISPDTKTIRDLKEGEILEGKVTRIQPYGAFVDIGVGRDALLHVREMSEGYVKRPEDVIQVGEELEVRIISVSRRRNRIDLSIKGLRPEPETEETAEAPESSAEEQTFEEDKFEDVEVLSAIELAFKRAMEGDNEEKQPKKVKARNSGGSGLVDDIISRTLKSGTDI